MTSLSNPQPNGSSVPGAHKAVEVVGMLGDSVVSVDHLHSNPETSSKQSVRSAYAFFGAGALFLIVAAIAFYKGFTNATANKAALQAWVDAGIPAWQFEPTNLSLSYDALALGGLFTGIAAFTFGLFRLRAKTQKSTFTVGNSADADFSTAHVAVASFPMVRAEQAGPVVTVAAGMTAEIVRGGIVQSLESLQAVGLATPSAVLPGAYDVVVPENGSVKLTAGPSSFSVRSVPETKSRVASLIGRMDRRAVAFIAGSAIVHAAFVILLATIPPKSKSVSLDLGSSDAVAAHLESKDSLELETLDESDDDGASEMIDDASSGTTSANGDPGQAGSDSPNSEDGSNKVKGDADKVKLSRAEAITAARTEGIAGAFSGSTLSQITGLADFTEGSDAMTTYGPRLEGDGSAEGEFGRHRFGPDDGGGGNNDIIRLPDNWYKQPGSKTGGEPKLGPRTSKHPTAEIRNLKVAEGLDKATVKRKIRQKMSLIRYYYEKQLLVDSDLEGTLDVRFLISSRGKVMYVRATGMNHPELQRLVENVIKTIVFPMSKNGVPVEVSYPISFRKRG